MHQGCLNACCCLPCCIDGGAQKVLRNKVLTEC
jgi:hypothetical protein